MLTLPRLAQACLLAGGFLLAVGTAPGAGAATEYPLGADSKPQEGVPRGRWVEGQFRAGDDSLFPGTTRPYALYVPAQYDGKSPAAVMVFQDGKGMADTWRVGPVFDNLIHRKELPVILGVFVAPGVVPPLSTNELARFNRSFEYDSLGDRYARFLTAEFLPFVERTHEVRFTTEPAGRAIAGASSGGIAAFNAAWEQPGAFSRVFCTIGTFVGLRGGNAFPVLVRKTEPKALRIFLQDGSSDLDIYGGNWWIANQDMLSALEFAGYEVNHAWGDGGHDGKHGAAVFPEAMRWLWRDHPKPVASAKPSRNTFLQQILLPGETWTVASQGHTGVSSPVAGRDGEVFFADGAAERIHRIDPAGKVTEFARDTGGAQALAFGADGRLYALGQNTGKVLRFDATGRAEVVAEEARASAAVRTPRGMYFADGDNRAIAWLDRQGARGSLPTELSRLRGLAISPDQRLLYAADAATQWVWSYVLAADGTPGLGQPYFHLHVGDRTLESGAEAMTVDADGRLYVATHLGVQICDQAGRVNAILPLPANATATGIGFAGARLDLLHLAVGDTLYRRRMAVSGVIPDAAAIRPAPPRL